ncbi:amidohydrolase [Virgibacillus halodenitrificans]|uniref:amidohydrolase n=1 Tax=Virgibacillus halodenitrificans TaxID=1482 RepID=UPI000307F4FC|nr:amidohydrolase [Virgibacillus halodenitrificans]
MNEKWLLNVKLETGAYTDEDNYSYTNTKLFHLKIKDGRIAEQVPCEQSIHDNLEKTDMKGLLAVPSFKEMHNHLDKTYMGLGWRSIIPVTSLQERLELEAKELKELAGSTKDRASRMIETLLSHGATHIRTHVNIDPYIGLENLEGVLSALDTYKGKVTADIIAFPQHGLLRDEVPSLMREAMRSGATMVGGLDPAGIDNSIEESLDMTMDIASEFNADVDIHLHDDGHVGWYTIDKWIDMVENTNWKGKSAISHAFCIGQIPEAKAAQLAQRLHQNQIAIMSTIPLTKTLPPIDLLDRHGVNVHLGCDGFFDSWGPFGTGDVLEKATKFCEITGKKDERSIAQSLKYITNGLTPLNEAGEQVWPRQNDKADFVFVDAESSAHMIARKIPRRAVMVDGTIVYGSIE